MSLQRMIVIPPDTFERWKKIVVEDKKLSDLDREMKKVLYNPKLNDISKWHFYRQNLTKYLNAKKYRINELTKSQQKHGVRSVDTQTKFVKHKHKKLQTSPVLPKQKSIELENDFIKSDIPSLDEMFSHPNQFSALEDEDTTGENELTELDVDDIVRSKALEGQPLSTKIIGERQSLDPNDYRIFELNNGETVTVPVERQMITRGALKRGYQPDDTSQNKSSFQKKKRKKNKDTTQQQQRQQPQGSSTSTPKKTKKLQTSWTTYK